MESYSIGYIRKQTISIITEDSKQFTAHNVDLTVNVCVESRSEEPCFDLSSFLDEKTNFVGFKRDDANDLLVKRIGDIRIYLVPTDAEMGGVLMVKIPYTTAEHSFLAVEGCETIEVFLFSNPCSSAQPLADSSNILIDDVLSSSDAPESSSSSDDSSSSSDEEEEGVRRPMQRQIQRSVRRIHLKERAKHSGRKIERRNRHSGRIMENKEKHSSKKLKKRDKHRAKEYYAFQTSNKVIIIVLLAIVMYYLYNK
jgi:hypothetical protein